jgi:hypothetical protein
LAVGLADIRGFEDDGAPADADAEARLGTGDAVMLGAPLVGAHATRSSEVATTSEAAMPLERMQAIITSVIARPASEQSSWTWPPVPTGTAASPREHRCTGMTKRTGGYFVPQAGRTD